MQPARLAILLWKDSGATLRLIDVNGSELRSLCKYALEQQNIINSTAKGYKDDEIEGN